MKLVLQHVKRVIIQQANSKLINNCIVSYSQTRNKHSFQNALENKFTSVKLASHTYTPLIKNTKVFEKCPIVLLHGLFGSKHNWSSVGQQIADTTDSKTYALDIRNHGDSSHSDVNDYEALALDVNVFLQEKGVDECILIGHSMGGRLAMTLSLILPSLVQKLVVIDMSPLHIPNFCATKVPIFIKALKKAVDTIPQDTTELTQAKEHVSKFMSTFLPDPQVRDTYVSNVIQTEDLMFKWAFNYSVLQQYFLKGTMDFPLFNTQFKSPTMFICGAKSAYLKVEHHNDIQTLFPQAMFHHIENASHWVFFDQRDKFFEVLCPFLNAPMAQ